ncbi:Cupin 2 conserved barrel domain protein [Crenothrix polyspora]|uniref:Cupin 2 conserved barrel domain protein n=1 Tax=Crenothrix polyspora TaxID=360316 RepID=A0A1R4H3X8_9GAMM|nr:cupin domain-containing protein [Crenothrix polyspora]SJM90886.1 Cupin 2 conserved barrel domain protein [Crenothrix polyspora]
MFKLTTRKSAFISLLLSNLLVIPIANVFAEDNVVLQRSTLLEKAVELPSTSVNTKVIRVTFPPAFKTPLHTHEGSGPRYVINGKLKVADKSGEKTYTTGQVFWETGEEMTIENIGSGSAEIIIFELAPVK